jgi:putative phosphoesterase
MKILIVSDSHGRNYYLEKAIKRVQPIDLLIHLGDYEGSQEYIKAIAPCKVEMVSGNNDYNIDMDKDKLITIGNYSVFLTHGHRYGVNYGIDRIKEIGMEYGASIVIFGHTHRPLIDLSSSIWAINPGSISQPRQEGGIPTFIIMDIDTEGKAHFTLNYSYSDKFL